MFTGGTNSMSEKGKLQLEVETGIDFTKDESFSLEI